MWWLGLPRSGHTLKVIRRTRGQRMKRFFCCRCAMGLDSSPELRRANPGGRPEGLTLRRNISSYVGSGLLAGRRDLPGV